MFSPGDYEIVKSAMNGLPLIERRIIQFRFWELCDFETISRRLRIDAAVVDQVLTRALKKLRTACITAPGFSRSDQEARAA